LLGSSCSMSGRLRLGTNPATNPSLSCIVNGTHCDARPNATEAAVRRRQVLGGERKECRRGYYQGPIPGSLGPCVSAPAITRCCASDSGSPSLTGRCQDVSDRVGTGGVAEGFPLERILSARVFITICGPEKFVCKRL